MFVGITYSSTSGKLFAAFITAVLMVLLALTTVLTGCGAGEGAKGTGSNLPNAKSQTEEVVIE